VIGAGGRISVCGIGRMVASGSKDGVCIGDAV